MTGSSSIGFASGPTPQIAEALELAAITSTHWPSSILSRPIRTRAGIEQDPRICPEAVVRLAKTGHRTEHVLHRSVRRDPCGYLRYGRRRQQNSNWLSDGTIPGGRSVPPALAFGRLAAYASAELDLPQVSTACLQKTSSTSLGIFTAAASSGNLACLAHLPDM
jgi:hypothetical protein